MITFGPYPEEEDFERLEKAGVKYMVSLLDPRLPYENTLVERERVRAKKHHMTLEVFPMASIMDHRIFSDYPDELNRAVDFLVNLDAPAYLHCYLGRNRTVHVRDALLKAKLPKRYWTPVAATEDYWALTSRIVNAQAEFRHGNYARTLEILAPVTARDCDVALLRGWSFYRLGMISEATENFRQGLGVDPADTRNLVGLGYCYLRSGQPALAQQQFNAVLEQVSNEPDALAGLGLSHLRLGSKAAAAVAFRKALEEDPRNQEVKAYLQQAEAP
jgi:tetratricopeptide (TPR) repeat protein